MMKTLELIETEPATVKAGDLIHLPYGLLGFEPIKRYLLVANPNEEPFMWFKMTEDPHQAFLVLSPFIVKPDYQPDISADDVDFLGLAEPEDALLLNICTVRGSEQPTINLKGPIVINRNTFVGKQVIPNNASKFQLRFPLPVA
jgi:flagellar assembly factor FliW